MKHLFTANGKLYWLVLATTAASLALSLLRPSESTTEIQVEMPCREGGGMVMMPVDAGTAWRRHASLKGGQNDAAAPF